MAGEMLTNSTNYTLSSSDSIILQFINDYVFAIFVPQSSSVGALMGVGVIGNLLVGFVFGLRLPMCPHNFLILTLAALDLLCCVVVMPMDIVQQRYFVMFENEFECKIYVFNQNFFFTASSLVLLVVAVDRYRKICRPLNQQMSLRHTKMAVAAVVIAACVLALPGPLVAGILDYNYTQTLVLHFCSPGFNLHGGYFYFIYKTFLAVGCFATFVVLTVLYVRIWKALRKHNRQILGTAEATAAAAAEGSTVSSTAQLPATAIRTRKTTAVALCVTVVFFLSFAPCFAGTAVLEFGNLGINVSMTPLYAVFFRFPYLNAVANPFIYSALNPAFRAECFKLFTCFPFCCKRCREVQSDNHTEDDNESERERDAEDGELVTISSL